MKAPPTACSMLSMWMTVSPAMSIVERRFSFSSSEDAWFMAGGRTPDTMRPGSSDSSDFPVPAAGASKACAGAVRRLDRMSAVRIAETATARAASPDKREPAQWVFERLKGAQCVVMAR